MNRYRVAIHSPGFLIVEASIARFLAEPRWTHTSSSFPCFLTEDIADAAYRRHKTSLIKQLERTLLWVFSCFYQLPREAIPCCCPEAGGFGF